MILSGNLNAFIGGRANKSPRLLVKTPITY
nr:MAG TPA: hypothetical protein [Caudoviricetes sp.]DAX20523.1 MAG TPA: hypothetical protein [Caudoviricetes sp.]